MFLCFMIMCMLCCDLLNIAREEKTLMIELWNNISIMLGRELSKRWLIIIVNITMLLLPRPSIFNCRWTRHKPWPEAPWHWATGQVYSVHESTFYTLFALCVTTIILSRPLQSLHLLRWWCWVVGRRRWEERQLAGSCILYPCMPPPIVSDFTRVANNGSRRFHNSPAVSQFHNYLHLQYSVHAPI